MQWHSQIENLHRGRTIRMRILCDQMIASYAEILDGWQHDSIFRDFFVELLAEAPFEAYLWETPAVSCLASTERFEFVLVESLDLARRRPDPAVFADHFNVEREVVAFQNLGGDALLLAPCPRSSLTAYTHLAAFVRSAQTHQKHAFWKAVGEYVSDNLSDLPLWLSTNGLGVSWLHVRLDSKPKYYNHKPYKLATT